jgi:HEAT repeat protein
MQPNSEFDFLNATTNTHDLYAQHLNDNSDDIRNLRKALATDSRTTVRRNAVVALTAAEKERANDAYISALDDPAVEVVTEAALALASTAPAYISRPANESSFAALRAHAARLRDALSSQDVRVRFNAAFALGVIEDKDVSLSTLLHDSADIVRGEGLALAASRELRATDVEALAELAHASSNANERVKAVNLVAFNAPRSAKDVIVAALNRDDVDAGTARAVRAKHIVGVVPAIVEYIKNHNAAGEWFEVLADLNAVCAARAIADQMREDANVPAALEALRRLSGHPDWSRVQLEAWASQQVADAAPCVAGANLTAPSR